MDVGFDRSRWEGLESLREELEPRLRRFCRDESEMEDVIQETILRAARYRPQLRDPGRLVPWSTRIARNVLSDLRRVDLRDGGQQPEEEDDEVQPPAVEEESPPYRMGRYEIDAEDAVDLLGELLPQLRWDDRAVLDSFYHGAEKSEVTARECHIPRRLVKVRLFRARQRLCRALRHRLAVRHAQLPDAARAELSA